MAHENDEGNQLRAFEAALAALAPRGDRLARDRLMFLAGQASVTAGSAIAGDSPVAHGAYPRRAVRSQPGWAWRAACGVASAAAVVLLVLWSHKPAPQVVERIVEVPVYVAAAAQPDGPASDSPSVAPSTATASRGAAADSDDFSARRRRLRPSTPGWWALLGGATELTAGAVSGGADSTYASLAAQLRESPLAVDLRDLPTGRDYRTPAVSASTTPGTPSPPSTPMELRDELLRGGPWSSPAAPKTIQPKGARS